MIEYNIDFKFNTKGGAVLLVEIIDDNKFTNEIYEIDGNKEDWTWERLKMQYKTGLKI